MKDMAKKQIGGVLVSSCLKCLLVEHLFLQIVQNKREKMSSIMLVFSTKDGKQKSLKNVQTRQEISFSHSCVLHAIVLAQMVLMKSKSILSLMVSTGKHCDTQNQFMYQNFHLHSIHVIFLLMRSLMIFQMVICTMIHHQMMIVRVVHVLHHLWSRQIQCVLHVLPILCCMPIDRPIQQQQQGQNGQKETNLLDLHIEIFLLSKNNLVNFQVYWMNNLFLKLNLSFIFHGNIVIMCNFSLLL
mmetsp:Transcript_12968/g.19599  ORF Transcript_12968/g.19599 Transcript_12968/m.19599 type:complete len:242 (-) Transcript_12968:3-728(-)